MVPPLEYTFAMEQAWANQSRLYFSGVGLGVMIPTRATNALTQSLARLTVSPGIFVSKVCFLIRPVTILILILGRLCLFVTVTELLSPGIAPTLSKLTTESSISEGEEYLTQFLTSCYEEESITLPRSSWAVAQPALLRR